MNKKCNCYLWFIFIFILCSSIGISHIAFSSSNLTYVIIFYSWRLLELFKGVKKSRGKQIEVHWRHQHKFWSITLHIEGWCVAKPLIVLHNAFLCISIDIFLIFVLFKILYLCHDIAELLYIKPPILCRAQGIDFLTWDISQKVGVLFQSFVLKQLGA